MIRNTAGHNNSKGQSSVEMAFALLIGLAFFMLVWDGVNIGYNWVSLQYVLSCGLQDVQKGYDQATISANITQNATALAVNNGLVRQFGDEGLNNPNQGSPQWQSQWNRKAMIITLHRTVPFGPFLKAIFQGISLTPSVTLNVSGYAEEPPS